MKSLTTPQIEEAHLLCDEYIKSPSGKLTPCQSKAVYQETDDDLGEDCSLCAEHCPTTFPASNYYDEEWQAKQKKTDFDESVF